MFSAFEVGMHIAIGIQDMGIILTVQLIVKWKEWSVLRKLGHSP